LNWSIEAASKVQDFKSLASRSGAPQQPSPIYTVPFFGSIEKPCSPLAFGLIG